MNDGEGKAAVKGPPLAFLGERGTELITISVLLGLGTITTTQGSVSASLLTRQRNNRNHWEAPCLGTGCMILPWRCVNL